VKHFVSLDKRLFRVHMQIHDDNTTTHLHSFNKLSPIYLCLIYAISQEVLYSDNAEGGLKF
jgi:hypothetical protein